MGNASFVMKVVNLVWMHIKKVALVAQKDYFYLKALALKYVQMDITQIKRIINVKNVIFHAKNA